MMIDIRIDLSLQEDGQWYGILYVDGTAMAGSGRNFNIDEALALLKDDIGKYKGIHDTQLKEAEDDARLDEQLRSDMEGGH